MRVLACETTQEACSVAYYDTAGAHEIFKIIGRGHAEHLMGQMAALCARHSLRAQTIDRLAVGVGPGSFTGVRIGIAAMRGLALAWDKPLCGIGSLAAIAHGARARDARTRAAFVVALDARRGAFYAQAFASPAQALSCPQRLEEKDLARLARRHRARTLIGNVPSELARSHKLQSVPAHPHAKAVAALATKAESCSAEVKPLYLQAYQPRRLRSLSS